MRGEAFEFVVGVLGEVLRPRERLELPEWMRRNVVLRPEESLDSPGRYDPSRSLPMARLFAKFNRESQWRRLVVKKGSQSGFTLHCLGDIAQGVVERPQNMIFVMDSLAEARKISRKRLGPLLEDCAETAGLFAETEDEHSTLEFSFPGMSLWLFGAGSPGQLASKSCGRMYADEVDKHPQLRGEAGTLDLLWQRGKAVRGSRLIAGSTPTTEEGAITVEHKAGSQHVYMVPCPRCGVRQVLEIPDPEKSAAPLVFEHCARAGGELDLERVLRETYYRCSSCGGEIVDADKPGMLEGGEWEATNFRAGEDGEEVPGWAPGVMSACLSDLYSVHANSTFGQIAVEWLAAREDARKMHNLLNGRLAREVKAAVFEVRPAGVRRLCGGYVRGTMPEVPCILTVEADNQGSGRVKWVVSGWMECGDQYVIDWGELDDRDGLDEVMGRRFDCGGRMLCAQRGIIDEGGEEGTTWEVREWSAARPGIWLPSKGRGDGQINDLAIVRPCSIAKGGAARIPVLHFDDDAFKRKLYLNKIARFRAKGAEGEEGPIGSRLWLPRDATEQLFRELSGESLRRVAGKVRWVASPPNDFGDCVKLGYVLWSVIGPEFDGARSG